MTAYRLHFRRANLEAIQLVNSGKLGAPRFFTSTFSMQVKPGIRTRASLGGGTLFDIGIYCINAARYLFKSDPEMAFAFSTRGYDKRFTEVDERTAATLRRSTTIIPFRTNDLPVLRVVLMRPIRLPTMWWAPKNQSMYPNPMN